MDAFDYAKRIQPGAANARVGRVILIGAGSGDPELLTLKAVRALQQADVVLADDLVHPEVLRHAPASARVERVGKRGGRVSTPQAMIHRLMLEAARRGQHVVRVKGGDPGLFGRLAEEVQALRDAGIVADLVPGISAAQAAGVALGTGLTHRDFAHGVMLVTGHAQSGGTEPDWEVLGRAAHSAQLTLVVYMPRCHIDAITSALLRGLPRGTPVAVVTDASLPTEQRSFGTLEALQELVRASDADHPCVCLIGNVLLASGAWQQAQPQAPQALAA